LNGEHFEEVAYGKCL